MIRLVEKYKQRIFFLAYKKISVEELTTETFVLTEEDVSCFPLSMNTIYILNIQEKKYFFRECPRHDNLRVLFERACDDFVIIARKGLRLENFKQEIPIRTKFSDKEINNFLIFLSEWKSSNRFWKEIKNLEIYLKQSHFGIWNGNLFLSDGAMTKLGIPQYPESLVEIIAYFFTFISGPLFSWNFHSFLKEGEYETFFASRTIASYELAKCLNCERLITPAKFVKVIISGEVHYGVLCDKAEGVRALDSKALITPQLQKELLTLNILDALSYQNDHFVNNYNIITDKDNIAISVCAFDNDSKWTFAPFPFCPLQTARNGSPVIKDGLYNRPFIPEDFWCRLKSIDIKEFDMKLSPYLNSIQIWALKKRIKQLASLKTIDKKKVLANREWNDNTVTTELSGHFGNTYLKQYEMKEELNNGYNG